MAITVNHKLLKRRGKIRTRRFSSEGYDHYKLRLYLTGELSNVEKVVYQLHSTFADPLRIIVDPSQGYALDIWTWGEFHVPVTVHLKDGSLQTLEHDLEYSDELPAGDGAYTSEGVRS